MTEQAKAISLDVSNLNNTIDTIISFATTIKYISSFVNKLDVDSNDLNVLYDCSGGYNEVCEKCNQMLDAMEKMKFDTTGKIKSAIEVLNKMRDVAIKLKGVQTNLMDRINKLQGKVTGEPVQDNKPTQVEQKTDKLLEDLINGLENSSSDELSTIPTVSNKPNLEEKTKEMVYTNDNIKAA